jgi:hypothetical protein
MPKVGRREDKAMECWNDGILEGWEKQNTRNRTCPVKLHQHHFTGARDKKTVLTPAPLRVARATEEEEGFLIIKPTRFPSLRFSVTL